MGVARAWAVRCGQSGLIRRASSRNFWAVAGSAVRQDVEGQRLLRFRHGRIDGQRVQELVRGLFDWPLRDFLAGTG